MPRWVGIAQEGRINCLKLFLKSSGHTVACRGSKPDSRGEEKSNIVQAEEPGGSLGRWAWDKALED